MGLFEHFPYTNFHDMNTDWLVKVAKEFMDKYETLQDTIDTATTGITELAETLEAQLNAWYDTHSEDIATQLANSLTAISNALNSATSAIATDRANAEQAIANDRNSAEMAIASARANSITDIENTLSDAKDDFDDHADEYGAEVIASLPPDYLNSLYGAHMVYPQHTKGVTGAMAHVAKIMVGKRLVPPPNPAIVDDATSNIIVFETGKGFVHGTMAIINKASSAFVSYPVDVQSLAGIASTDYLIVNESGFDYLDLDFMSDGMPEYAYRKYEDVHVTNFSTGSSISAQPTSYNGTNKAFTPFRMNGTLNVTGAVFAGLYNPETGAYISTVTTFPVTVEDKVVMVFSDTPNDVVIQVNDEGGGSGTEGAVLYSEAQNLTTLEKTQAKVNIGANFDNDINTLQTTVINLGNRLNNDEDDIEELETALNNISHTNTEVTNVLSEGVITPDYFFNTSGTTSGPYAGYWEYITFEVHAGELYSVTAGAGQSARLWLLLDESNNVVSYSQDATTVDLKSENVLIPTGVTKMIVNAQMQYNLLVYKTTTDSKIKPEAIANNIFAGKVLCCAGDSITYGADMDSDGITNISNITMYQSDGNGDFTLKQNNFLHTWGYQIAERNDMIFYNAGVTGSTMQGLAEKNGFSLANGRYTKLPDSIDYLLLWFGWNDTAYGTLGTINDATNESFYGGFNVVLPYLINKYPYAKIGIIVPYGCDVEHREAVRLIGNKWGVAVWDNYKGGTPLYYGKEPEVGVNASIVTANQAKFQANGAHPNFKGHTELSHMIENWMRGM